MLPPDLSDSEILRGWGGLAPSMTAPPEGIRCPVILARPPFLIDPTLTAPQPTAAMDGFLKFVPLYQERVWGGRGFAQLLGRPLPEGMVIGESWEIVDRPEAQSIVAEGPELGGTLRDLIASDPEAIMGAGWPAERPFPILVKWLDCQQRLSLQVHPPAAVAPALGGEPKTENWYVAHATPDAALLAGLEPGVGREQLAEALAAETAEKLITRLPVQTGCSLFVPSGRIHAIDAGNLILEIQQNSDTTYRVYDWGRVGLDGKPRQLHIEESLQSIDFSDTAPALLPPSRESRTLADSDVFRLREIVLREQETFELAAGEPQLIGMVAGRVSTSSGQSANQGDNCLVPASAQVSLIAAEPTVLLVTDQFTRA